MADLIGLLPPDVARLARMLPQILGEAGARMSRRPLDWPPPLFARLDRNNEPLRGPVDLTGGSRVFTNGPCVHLVPGRWTAVPSFRIGDNETNNRFKF